jgi:hypothetical protein
MENTFLVFEEIIFLVNSMMSHYGIFPEVKLRRGNQLLETERGINLEKRHEGNMKGKVWHKKQDNLQVRRSRFFTP